MGGPTPGSVGARAISDAHRGSHDHDKTGGFASNPELARAAGKKGGEAVKRKYGPQFYKEIGAKGGNVVAMERGPEFFSKIGKVGGDNRAKNIAARKKSQ